MTAAIPRLFVRLRRTLPQALFALAMLMQVAGPALHAGHEVSGTPKLLPATPVVASAAAHHDESSRHDAAGCLQCRLVSQLRTLSPNATAVYAPVLRTDWVTGTAALAACAQADRRVGPARAPPFFV